MWKLGRVFGIDVSLHWTLLLLIAFSGLGGGGIYGVLISAAVFGCVLLHELGHSLAARQYGIETDSIVLLPIGGIATLQRMPRKPTQELWIAVAGPLVNVGIAALLWMLLGVAKVVAPTLAPFVFHLMVINVGLVVFNMLPAFPMDGGRVLRSLLAMQLPYLRATQIAAKAGRIMAVLFGIAGLLVGNLMLMLIAVFVWFAGSAEARQVAAEMRNPLSWRDRFASSFRRTRNETAFRIGDAVDVIWDENERRYRYAYE